MRIYRLVLIVICLLASIQIYAQKLPFITLSLKNVPLETVLTQIKKQTGIQIFYDLEILKKAGKVSVTVEKASLSATLNQCLLNTQVGYNIVGGKIVVLVDKNGPKDDDGQPILNFNAFAKDAVHGFVYNTQGRGLANANVIIKRSRKGATTDAQGKFVLEDVRTNDTLNISYIGYIRQEVPVAMKTEFNIYMKEAENELDAVMVQAYGTTTKRLSVGEITQISGAELAKQPVTNVLLALKGMVPGMVVTPTTGFSGAPVKVEIRGRNSVADVPSDPLYVIDGVPIVIPSLGLAYAGNYNSGSSGLIQAGLSFSGGQSPLYGLSMQDIESVSILSDAAATARYGARAGNGVILITTKKGKPGATQFDINVDRSVNKAIGHWKMLNTEQYLAMRREALRNDGFAPSIAGSPDLTIWDSSRNIDWQKELWQANSATNVSTSLSGGNNIINFRLFGSYSSVQDISALSDQNKNKTAGMGLNLGYRSLNQKLTVSVNVQYRYTNNNQVAVGGTPTLAPNLPPIFDEKGSLNYGPFNEPGSVAYFPFQSILTPGTASTYSLTSGLNMGYRIIKGLEFSLNLGYNNSSAKTKTVQPIAAQNPIEFPLGLAIFGNNEIFSYNVNPILTYSAYIGKGTLGISIAGVLNNATSSGYTLMGAGYKGDELLKSINNAPLKTVTHKSAQSAFTDVNGSINYNWKSKYIIQFNGNRSGSSAFGPGRRFGNFWSAGANWFPLEEKWLKGVAPGWISLIKLSGNYGVTGRAGGDYLYLSAWSSGPLNRSYYNYNGNLPLVPVHAVNQDYRWETVKNLSGSLTLGFLEDKLNLGITIYRKNCDNQLSGLPTPEFTGFASVQGNLNANVRNVGTTATLNANIINTKDFSWSASFNISRNRNKLLSYPGIEYSGNYSRFKIGYPLNTDYLLHYLGIDQQTGKRAFQDYNNDGKIGAAAFNTAPGTGADDRYVTIDKDPRFDGGAGTDLRYKNFSLGLRFHFKKQMMLRSYTKTPGDIENAPLSVLTNVWRKPGDIAAMPAFTTLGNFDNLFTSSDGGYTDGSFLRLNNISAGYSLPDKLARKLGVKGLNFGVNIENIFTLTNYDGIDPEMPFGNFPQPRTFNGRLAITL
ncbi:SusC/RagA family TonB-linked outer membrane protein [Pedobacter africanus]|uniref:TonB-linked SusC/RagA family outer membrane protein n=1 Tax=Pedobacter africanus TaxID=151894 RepID=A0ACC6KWH1_9SPHI|nr:SusC/RagA family TonB-linked outer membrane protein [Pedobacter africanus]MDR6783515.1 TonB-linked SusC/RagA family outer membrane protein [Pedobacter africanus]